MSPHKIADRVEPGLSASWRVDGSDPLGTFVPEGVNDRLLQVSMALAAELWVTRRRLRAVESQLVASGTIASPDRLPANLDLQEREERDAFVQRIFGNFAE